MTTSVSISTALLPIVLLSLAGCHQTQDPLADFSRAEQVATYSIDATSVSRWQDISDGLQPSFKLDEDGALASVLPITSYEDYLRAHATSFGASLGLSTPSVGGTDKLTTITSYPFDPSTGEPVSTDKATPTLTQTSESNATRTVVTPAAAVAPPMAATLPSLNAPQLPGAEPQLKYDLATSLLQHVRLLNRQIKDSLKLHDLTPYVVTVKVNVQPIRRGLPLDLYYDLAFAIGTKVNVSSTPLANPAAAVQPTVPRTAYLESLGQKRADHLSLYTNFKVSPEKAADGSNPYEGAIRAPIVLPLLNYDSIESQLRTYTQNEIDSAALSLLAAYSSVGVRLDATDVRAELRRAYGRRNNSLLNIVKLAQNTVRVRLGAAYAPDQQGDEAMDTRERTISFVVLVPSQALLHGATVILAGRPHLRNSSNGLRLGSKDNADTNSASQSMLASELLRLIPPGNDWTQTEAKDAIPLLKAAAQQADLNRFVDILDAAEYKRAKQRIKSEDPVARHAIAKMWFAALGAPDGPVFVSMFPIDDASLVQWPYIIPETANPKLLLQPQLVKNDKRALLTVPNGKNLHRLGQPTAVLLSSDDKERIQATAVTVVPDGTALQAIFPLSPVDRAANAPAWTYSAQIDFEAPVRIETAIWDDLADPNEKRPADVDQVVGQLQRLPNGRYRLNGLGGMTALQAAASPPEPPSVRLAADQKVLVANKDDRTLTFRVERLPGAAELKKNPLYLRLNNAAISDPGPLPNAAAQVLVKQKDGRWQIVGTGEVTVNLRGAVVALAVTAETYYLKPDGSEVNPQTHFAVSVSP